MKEKTEIRHKNKSGDSCEPFLLKENWGCDNQGDKFYRLVCWKCGFAKVVTDDLLNKWQEQGEIDSWFS